MIRVVLVDDEALIREGVRMILEAADGIEVVGEAEDGEEAVALCSSLEPDVVAMDVRMPRCDGLQATERIVAMSDEPPAIVILTTFEEDEYVYRALRAGARGFLLKRTRPPELVATIRAVASGDSLLSPKRTLKLIETFTSSTSSAASPETKRRVENLSPLERRVLRHIAAGKTNGEIAEDLNYSVHTIRAYVKQILAKLGARNRVGCAIAAYEGGLVRDQGFTDAG